MALLDLERSKSFNNKFYIFKVPSLSVYIVLFVIL